MDGLMKFFIFLTTVISATLISGCATPFKDYEGSTQRAAFANKCEQQGLITSDDFAHYSEFQMGGRARQNMEIIDNEKMQSMYLAKVERFRNWLPSSKTERDKFELECSTVVVVASRVRGNNSAPRQSSPVYTPPKTTNCMTTYGWTRCTTD